MLVVTPISPGITAYFADGRDPGRWSGDGALALGVQGAIEAGSLRRVLRARHPQTGHPLGLRLPAHRRAGWDLTFAAPKSVSLLAAVAGPDHAALIAACHTGAVEDALTWMVARSCRGRRDGRLDAAGAVIARFEHTASDHDDPHLHSHAVLANLAVTADGRWSALAGSPLWTSLRALGEIYRLALRAHLAQSGFRFAWRQAAGPPGGRRDGLVEVAGVPLSAVRAVSRRGSEVDRILSGWEDPSVTSRASRRAVRGSTRTGHATAKGGMPAGGDQPQAGMAEDRSPVEAAPWRERLEATGWGRAAATELLASAMGSAPTHNLEPPPGPAGPHEAALRHGPVGDDALTRWLYEQGSTFSAMDVVRAIGATSPVGLRPAEVDAAVAKFCGDPAPFAHGTRWTTPQAARIDTSLLQCVARGWGAGTGDRRAVVDDSAVTAVAAAHHLDVRATSDLRRIAAGPAQVQVLAGQAGTSALIEQATILAAAGAAWRSAGFSVEVLAPGQALRRWDALAGVGTGGRAVRPDVLVVDRADRMSSVALQALLEASGPRTKVVLVDGGTLPARHHPLSGAFAEMLHTAGGRRPHGLAHGGGAPDRAHDDQRVVTLGAISVGRGPSDALGALVARWAALPPDRRPVLVGFGPAEVEALNAAGRRRRVAQGELSGPAVTSAARAYQVGDAVVALRRLRVAAGTAGTVTDVDRAAGVLTVDWGGRSTTVDRHEARRIGHGYAVTPARVPAGAESVLVLGDPRRVARLRGRVAGVALVAATPTTVGRGRLGAAVADALTTARRAAPPGHVPPGRHASMDTQRPLMGDEALGEMRGRLSASMPPDPRVARRLADERASWERQRHQPPVDAASGAVDPRTALDTWQAQNAWRAWVEAHAEELVAFHRSDEASQFREAALARAGEIDPGCRWIGPPAPARVPHAARELGAISHTEEARTAGVARGSELGGR